MGTTMSKRQRRPSVRLGEIGDAKNSKVETISTVRWMSPSFLPRSSLVKATKGKLPRNKALAILSGGESVQGGVVLPSSVATDTDYEEEDEEDEDGDQEQEQHHELEHLVVEDECEEQQDEDEEEEGEEEISTKTEKVEECRLEEMGGSGPPSTSGRVPYGNLSCGRVPYGALSYGIRKGKHGKRKRAANIRFTKTVGIVTLNRKADDLQMSGEAALVPETPSNIAYDVQDEFRERNAEQVDLDKRSRLVRPLSNHNRDESERGHEENVDEEILREQEESQSEDWQDDLRDAEGKASHDMNAGEATRGIVAPKEDTNQSARQLTTNVCEERTKGVGAKETVAYGGQNGGVKTWLNSLGLSKYFQHFVENEVDNDVLPLLTFDDLREMGVTAVGARRKMFAAIQELAGGLV